MSYLWWWVLGSCDIWLDPVRHRRSVLLFYRSCAWATPCRDRIIIFISTVNSWVLHLIFELWLSCSLRLYFIFLFDFLSVCLHLFVFLRLIFRVHWGLYLILVLIHKVRLFVQILLSSFLFTFVHSDVWNGWECRVFVLKFPLDRNYAWTQSILINFNFFILFLLNLHINILWHFCSLPFNLSLWLRFLIILQFFLWWSSRLHPS